LRLLCLVAWCTHTSIGGRKKLKCAHRSLGKYTKSLAFEMLGAKVNNNKVNTETPVTGIHRCTQVLMVKRGVQLP